MKILFKKNKLFLTTISFATILIISQCKKTAEEVVQIKVPSISSFTPESATVGASVTITGSNFSTTASDNKVTFLGADATRIAANVSVASTTSISTTVPVGAISGKIWVQVGDSIAKATTAFSIITAVEVVAIPTITSVTPNNAAVGTDIVIAGTNLLSKDITFLGSAGRVVAVVKAGATTNSITVTVPTGATTGKIWVQVKGTSDAPNRATIDFTVNAAPPAPSVTYNGQIKSKLTSCTGCHSSYGTNYASDKANAETYNGKIQDGSMPKGAPWSSTDRALFKSWIDAGKPE